MKGSFRIGTLAGIGVFVHWTFFLLLAWIALGSATRGGLGGAIFGILFVLAVFGCIVLHELGHALTARRFGISTRDITLLPIGGLARLERMPDDPKQELLVAIAGPLVNVAIAAVLFGVLAATRGLSELVPEAPFAGALLVQLLWVNLLLVGFNLLPAFPMDGGRVLRALLAMRMNYTRATDVAARIGQGLAIALGFLGLFTNPFLILIAFFVFFGASEEARMTQVRSWLSGLPVQAAMMPHFRALAPDDTLADAARELLAGSQVDFPVTRDGRLVGMLRRKAIFEGLSGGGRPVRIESVMDRDVEGVEETAMLDRVASEMRGKGIESLPVLRDGCVVGVISLENVGELVMIRSALGQESKAPGSDPGRGYRAAPSRA